MSTERCSATRASGNAPISLEIPSTPVYLCAVRSFVGEVCRRHGFSDMQASQIVLGVDEALANVMRHGYEGRADGKIAVRITHVTDSAKGPGLEFVIDDWGRQVDVATIRSRDLRDVRPGGLGVHIIRQVMDVARYEAPAGQGMRLTLVKFVSSPPATGDGLDGGVDCCACGGDHG